jgi:hypothetical protein
LGTPLVDLQVRLAALAKRRDRLAVLPRVVLVIDDLRESGMGPLVDDLAARGVAATDVAPEMNFVWWTSLLDDISVRDSAYGAHDGDFLRRVGSEYIEADHAHLSGSVTGCAPRSVVDCARSWPTTLSRRRWCARRRASRVGTGPCATCCPGPPRP